MDFGHYGVTDVSKTNEDITPESVADPEVLPGVGGDWLLVRPVNSVQEKTAGGILLADTTLSDVKYLNNVGRILAFGPRAFKTKDDKIINWVEGGLNVGDIVQWERFVGKRIRYRGVNLVMIKDVAVQLKLESASDVDPNINIEA